MSGDNEKILSVARVEEICGPAEASQGDMDELRNSHDALRDQSERHRLENERLKRDYECACIEADEHLADSAKYRALVGLAEETLKFGECYCTVLARGKCRYCRTMKALDALKGGKNGHLKEIPIESIAYDRGGPCHVCAKHTTSDNGTYSSLIGWLCNKCDTPEFRGQVSKD